MADVSVTPDELNLRYNIWLEEEEKKREWVWNWKGGKEGEKGCVKGNTGIVASDGVQAFIHGHGVCIPSNESDMMVMLLWSSSWSSTGLLQRDEALTLH